MVCCHQANGNRAVIHKQVCVCVCVCWRAHACACSHSHMYVCFDQFVVLLIISDDHTPAGSLHNLVVLFVITVADCQRTQAFWPECSI